MRVGRVWAGLLPLCLAAAGCNAQDTDSPAAGEDQGQFPDGTATESNMIVPSDDAGMPTDTAAATNPSTPLPTTAP